MLSNNFFKMKLSLLEFKLIPTVKQIIKEIEDIDLNERKSYILENKLDEKLRNIYWTKMYGTYEEFKIAEDILDNTLFSGKTSDKELLLKQIEELCIDKDKTELFNKIKMICPNGDSIVSFLIQEMLNE